MCSITTTDGDLHGHDAATGLTLPSTPFLGWGTDFLDYDNDGWLDLLVVNGHIYPAADTFPWNTSYAQRALLFRNVNGKRFEDLGAAAGGCLPRRACREDRRSGTSTTTAASTWRSTTSTPAPTLARNDGGARAGHWLTITLERRPGQEVPARRRSDLLCS